MKTFDTSHIADLLSRFMDGTSTLEEERTLAEYFQTAQVPDEWLAYKEMFAWFDEGMPEPAKLSVAVGRWTALRRVAVAAAVVLVAGVGALLLWPEPKAVEIAQVEKVIVPEVVEVEAESPTPIVQVAEKTVQPKALKTDVPVANPQPKPVPQIDMTEVEKMLVAENAQLRAEMESLREELNEIRRSAVSSHLEAKGFRTVEQKDGTLLVEPQEDKPKYIAI